MSFPAYKKVDDPSGCNSKFNHRTVVKYHRTRVRIPFCLKLGISSPHHPNTPILSFKTWPTFLMNGGPTVSISLRLLAPFFVGELNPLRTSRSTSLRPMGVIIRCQSLSNPTILIGLVFRTRKGRFPIKAQILLFRG